MAIDSDFEGRWNQLVQQLDTEFGGDAELDVQAILFLIGVQELGKGNQNFSKNEKLELLHIAICTILSPFGYYKLTHQDEDGWPHFETLKPLPHLNAGEQLKLMKQAILDYFKQAY